MSQRQHFTRTMEDGQRGVHVQDGVCMNGTSSTKRCQFKRYRRNATHSVNDKMTQS